MSGHSKWANIKNRKGAQDKKRSTVFTKAAKDIITAVRAGGGNTNPESNPKLRVAIDKSREVNMPKENVERLLKRFEERKANLVGLRLEGYAPGGIPLVIEAETDNKNRSLGEIKNLLKEYGGNLAEEGSVSYLFTRMGEIELDRVEPEKELEIIDAGVEEIEDNLLYVKAEELKSVVDALEVKGIKVEDYRLVMKANTPIIITDENKAGEVVDLIEALEENEDVTTVFAAFKYQSNDAQEA